MRWQVGGWYVQAASARIGMGGLEDVRHDLDLSHPPGGVGQPGPVFVLGRVVVPVLFLGGPAFFNEARDCFPKPGCSSCIRVHVSPSSLVVPTASNLV